MNFYNFLSYKNIFNSWIFKNLKKTEVTALEICLPTDTQIPALRCRPNWLFRVSLDNEVFP